MKTLLGLSVEQVAEILKLYNQGVPLPEIGRRFNLVSGAKDVDKLRRLNGVPTLHRQRKSALSEMPNEEVKGSVLGGQTVVGSGTELDEVCPSCNSIEDSYSDEKKYAFKCFTCKRRKPVFITKMDIYTLSKTVTNPTARKRFEEIYDGMREMSS